MSVTIPAIAPATLASATLVPSGPVLVAWSRLLFRQEVVVAINIRGAATRGGFVTVDRQLHPPGSALSILYDGSWTPAQLAMAPTLPPLAVTDDNGRSVVRIQLPPAGMTILA